MTTIERIKIKMLSMKFIADDIIMMLGEIETGIGQESGGSARAPGREPDGNLDKAPLPVSSNPYADTPDKVLIQTDDHLYLESTATAPYLQSRFCRILWDIADTMNVQLEIANACLLEGAPANNPAHYADCRTIDIRYLTTDAETKEVIKEILASFPVLHTPFEEMMDECEVRVSPEIRDRLNLPWIKRIQADPEGNHGDHMNVRFWK